MSRVLWDVIHPDPVIHLSPMEAVGLMVFSSVLSFAIPTVAILSVGGSVTFDWYHDTTVGEFTSSVVVAPLFEELVWRIIPFIIAMEIAGPTVTVVVVVVMSFHWAAGHGPAWIISHTPGAVFLAIVMLAGYPVVLIVGHAAHNFVVTCTGIRIATGGDGVEQ